MYKTALIAEELGVYILKSSMLELNTESQTCPQKPTRYHLLDFIHNTRIIFPSKHWVLMLLPLRVRTDCHRQLFGRVLHVYPFLVPLPLPYTLLTPYNEIQLLKKMRHMEDTLSLRSFFICFLTLV